MITQVLTDQLIAHEGLRLKPYRCPAGKLTIGIGRNLDDKGITRDEAIALLHNDLYECIDDLQHIFQRFYYFPEIVRRVLIDMRFNLGATGFRSFKRMIEAVKNDDYGEAALEMQDSNWYEQVGKRAETLVDMMLKAV